MQTLAAIGFIRPTAIQNYNSICAHRTPFSAICHFQLSELALAMQAPNIVIRSKRGFDVPLAVQVVLGAGASAEIGWVFLSI